MKRSRNRSKAQSTLEYVVLIAVVVGAILGVQQYVRRAVEGRGKQSADQIGEQWSSGDSRYNLTVTASGNRTDGVAANGFSSSNLSNESQTRNATNYLVGVLGKITDKLFN